MNLRTLVHRRMVHRRIVNGLIVWGLLWGWAAAGGASAQDLISRDLARRFGLERMWFTQVAVDSARGRIAHVTQHVSNTMATFIFEVSYDDIIVTITSNDLDPYGMPLGREGAQKKAENLVQGLELRGKTASMVEQSVPQITLVFTTDRGGVDVIDAETGKRFWSTNIGNPNHPTLAPAVDDYHVAVVNGSYVHLLNRTTGELVWRRQTMNVPGAGPAINRSYVFVPMFNGALESFNVDDATQAIGVYRATGRSLIQPAITPRSVVWPTDKGHMYVAPADRVGIRFRVEAKKTIVATPAHAGRNLYIPSIDGYIYCVDEMTGGMLWTVSIGESLAREPIAVGDRLYVPSISRNLYCLSLDDGMLLWSASGIEQVLTVGGDRVFCVGTGENLVTLNLDTGSLLMSGSERLPPFRIANAVTNRIFLGTPRGLIQGLREVGEPLPTIHFPEEAPATGEEGMMDETNPFGEGAMEATEDATEVEGSNPFGAP